jgi:hypothetical protein
MGAFRHPAIDRTTEEVNKELDLLGYDMDRAFLQFEQNEESIKKLGSDFEDLCKRSASPSVDRIQRISADINLLDQRLKKVEGALRFVAQGHAMRGLATQQSTVRPVQIKAPDPGAAGPPDRGLVPARHDTSLERKVFEDVYRVLQEKAGIVVSGRNVVDVLSRMLEDFGTYKLIKDSVEKALGPFALPGEGPAETAIRIGNVASKMSDPVKTVMGECKNVRERLDAALERLRGHDLEGVEDRIAELSRSAERLASDVENIGLQFMSIDSIPNAIENLDKSISELGGLATDSSVVTTVATPELSCSDWGIEVLPLDGEEGEKIEKKLNVLLTKAIESVLIWTLKEGRGFKVEIVQKNIEQAMNSIVHPVLNTIAKDTSESRHVYEKMRHEIAAYFGMMY